MKYTTTNQSKASQFETNAVALKAAFESLPDPRRQNANLYYPLPAMLLAMVAALLSGQSSVLATAEWLSHQSLATQQALGFNQDRRPVQSTFQRLFAKLDWSALEAALRRVFAPTPTVIPPRGSEAIALDGKALRGKLKFETAETLASRVPVELLSLFSHDSGLLLVQSLIEPGSNESSTAPALLSQLDWHGRVVTGDAAFCQRELCKQLVEAGGDYLLAVKGNQATLLEEAETLFDHSLVPVGLAFDYRQAGQVDKGHGRIEVRLAEASNELAEVSDWPYLAQLLQVKRHYWRKGVEHLQTSYYVTSLPASVVDVAGLLDFKRGHWGIENRLHWVRDVVMGEDGCLVRKGNGPQVLAALRNTALNLLRRAGLHQITASLRRNASQPARVLRLLGL